jgi:hypothetical protein
MNDEACYERMDDAPATSGAGGFRRVRCMLENERMVKAELNTFYHPQSPIP